MGSKVNTFALTYAALGIVINIVFGTAVKMLHLPLLYLDTIGTIFTAVILGPWYGALTGGLTNVIQGILTNPKNIPFALVNMAIGLVVGFVGRKYKFDVKTAMIVGCILAVVAPLIGTPIAVWIYGGITGDGNDVIFTWLVQSGKTIFAAAFIPRITGNILDKLASCFLVALLINRIPNSMMKGKNNA